jgi:hypothetical protein
MPAAFTTRALSVDGQTIVKRSGGSGRKPALRMFDLTYEKLRFKCFKQTLDWMTGYQADWEHGEWHARISKTLQPSGGQGQSVEVTVSQRQGNAGMSEDAAPDCGVPVEGFFAAGSRGFRRKKAAGGSRLPR